MAHPIIIQGGMGVAISGWRLARAVSLQGQLGVVSGTLLPVVLARRLQQGDPDGRMRHALGHFPFPRIARRLLDAWFIPGGKAHDVAFRPVAMPTLQPGRPLLELTVAANFTEVFLAKENHAGLVGLNLLEKIQFPTLPSLFGAMLAGVDYVLMGAGIPRSIPGVLDRLARGEAVELKIDLEGAAPDAPAQLATFDPASFYEGTVPELRRPQFLAIVSSATLATTLARKSNGRVDGFVVENEVAGGHNAPPRGPLQLTAAGEPVYGARDLPDFEKIRALGLPFWLAGAQGHPDRLAEALRLGAAGVQIGTPFAFCEESGLAPELKQEACRLSRAGQTRVHTDPVASPTGFPFKVLQLPGTLSDPDAYAGRERICDLGYLRQAYTRLDGGTGYRCAGEPVDDFVRKGGSPADAAGRKCLCNGLLASAGLAQHHLGATEPPLVTAGNDVAQLTRYLPADSDAYTAADVLRVLLAPAPAG